jgi:hypothetical protein
LQSNNATEPPSPPFSPHRAQVILGASRLSQLEETLKAVDVVSKVAPQCCRHAIEPPIIGKWQRNINHTDSKPAFTTKSLIVSKQSSTPYI